MSRRKERAQKLAEKQEFAEKRHRLLNVLVQRLLLKHGPKTNHGLSKERISDAVGSYLDKVPSLVKVTNIRNTNDLELVLSNEIQNYKQPTREKRSQGLNSSDRDGGTNGKKIIHSVVETANDKKSMSDLDIAKNVNPWTLIETFQIIENESSIEQKKAKEIQKQKDVALTLDDQIQLKNETDKLNKREDDKFLEIQRNTIREWEDEQMLNEKAKDDKISELKNLRQKQVEETERKRKNERSEKLSSEIKEIECIKLDLINQEELKHQRKLEERGKWESIKTENAKKLEQQKLQKIEEAKMDAKLMEDMKRKYDEEESKRVHTLEDRKVKLEINGQLLSEAGTFSKREKMIEFEKDLLEAAAVKERGQALREMQKQDYERKKKQLITQCNKKMAEEKQRQEREAEKENETYALKCLQEKEALRIREEEAGRMQMQETKLQYRKALQSQIDEQKKNRANFDGMTEVELSMNKKLMKKLEGSDVKRKIIDKVMSCNTAVKENHNN